MNTPKYSCQTELEDFLHFDPREAESQSCLPPTEQFIELGKKTALDTFKLAAQAVPAYKDFLRKHKIDPDKIGSFNDFEKLPLTNKKNYLQAYPLKDLLLGNTFQGKWAISSSSGSSGKPFYWPRVSAQDFGAAKGLEALFVSLFSIDKKSTLFLNCAGLGVWTGGDMSTICIKFICLKYPHNSSINPGIDLENALNLIKEVGPDFEQVVLLGYPPFLKDIIDNLHEDDTRKVHLRFLAYGEPFSESWRNHMVEKSGHNEPAHTVAGSLLGSSEVGLVGSEGPSAIIIRQQAYASKNLCQALFGEQRIPSLVQYNPISKYIEIIDSNLVITNKGALPLIRYDSLDYGGALTSEGINQLFIEHLNTPLTEILGAQKIPNSKLPYVYLFGRSDNTTTIYGVNIYPELIKEALANPDLACLLSGKFVMKTEYDPEGNQYLLIIGEMLNNIVGSPEMEKVVSSFIAQSLCANSSEYQKLHSSMGERVHPSIELRKFGDREHFSSRNKHKYILK